jgi:hypothetical protein
MGNAAKNKNQITNQYGKLEKNKTTPLDSLIYDNRLDKGSDQRLVYILMLSELTGISEA